MVQLGQRTREPPTRTVLDSHPAETDVAPDRDVAGELSEALAVLDRKIEHYDTAELGIDLDCSEQPINSVRLVEQ
jgi:hypothetical protein